MNTARFIFEHWRISSDSDLILIESVIAAAASTAGLTKPVTENISISMEHKIFPRLVTRRLAVMRLGK